MRLRRAAALLVVVALSSAAAIAEKPPVALPPYRDAKRTVDTRVADLLGRMTPAEKAPVVDDCESD